MDPPPPPPYLPPSSSIPPPLPPERPGFAPPPVPREGKGRAVLIPVIVLAIAGASLWAWKHKSSQRARFEAESAEDRAAGIRAAFHGSGTPVSLTSPEAKAIDAVLKRMAAAFVAKDAPALAECFDFAGLMEMAAGQNPNSDLKAAARQARRDSGFARKGALNGMQNLMKNSDHVSYVIRHLEMDAGGNQALALIIWKNADGSRSKERYWFIRGIDWRVCDLEELDTAIRMSTMAAAAAGDPAVLQSGRSAQAAFQELIAAVTEGEPDKARPLLVKVRKSPLIKLYGDVTDLIEVSMFMQEGKQEEALAAADRLLKRRPDMPVVHYQRSMLLSDMERHADSIAAAQKYLDILGDDPAALNLMASSHLALKEPDKARDCALRVLAEMPPDEEALGYFGRTARPQDAAKLEELLRKSDNSEGIIQTIASELASEPESAAFAVLIEVAEKVAPGAGVTASLKTGRRARELWAKASAAGAPGDDLLVAALKSGTAEEAEALENALLDPLEAAQDAAGLERLAAAGAKARPDSSGPMHAQAAALAIRLRPEIEKAADPDKSLLEALKSAALPGSVAWKLALAWQETERPDLVKKAAAALKTVAPDDEMNELMADFPGAGENETPTPETGKPQ